MKKIVFLSLLLYSFLHIAAFATSDAVPFSTQSPSAVPLHEVRAVWLTTIGGIDWPHSYSQSEASAARQKQELCDILDKLVSAGINTVLLQTRIRATTIFSSSMEPWDGCLSGVPARSPGYDALDFATTECHKRGLKLHAWVVSIPIGKWNSTGCKALRKAHPEITKRIGDEGYMDPENKGTAEYLARFCRDITERYDIDGIHLDYIRYPETWKTIRDKDAARSNITRIVRRIHDEVKAAKPWVMISCSPVGKYADTRRASSRGWNARDAVCQDAALWLQEGVMDCIFPMMYFRGDNFYPFAIDWKERAAGRLVVPGLGIYFLSPREKDWSLTDITREMHVLRQYGMGTCLFRSKFFTDNTKGIYDYSIRHFSPLPSLQPPMRWHETGKPAAPSALEARILKNGELMLAWSSEDSVLFNIYGSDHSPVDTKRAENLLAQNIAQKQVIMPRSAHIRYFAVTATDRYGNESAPTFHPTEDSKATTTGITPGLPVNDHKVILSSYDVTEGQLVIITSLQGNDLYPRLVKSSNGKRYIDAHDMPSGHYSVYFINRKKHRHKIGSFSIPPTSEFLKAGFYAAASPTTPH